jgi:hypothetical protein
LDVTKIYIRFLHIKFILYTTFVSIGIGGGNRAILTEATNTQNILSHRHKENYLLDVLDENRKVILKVFIIVYGAKHLETP